MSDEEELRARIEAQIAARRAESAAAKRERAPRRGKKDEDEPQTPSGSDAGTDPPDRDAPAPAESESGGRRRRWLPRKQDEQDDDRERDVSAVDRNEELSDADRPGEQRDDREPSAPLRPADPADGPELFDQEAVAPARTPPPKLSTPERAPEETSPVASTSDDQPPSPDVPRREPSSSLRPDRPWDRRGDAADSPPERDEVSHDRGAGQTDEPRANEPGYRPGRGAMSPTRPWERSSSRAGGNPQDSERPAAPAEPPAEPDARGTGPLRPQRPWTERPSRGDELVDAGADSEARAPRPEPRVAPESLPPVDDLGVDNESWRDRRRRRKADRQSSQEPDYTPRLETPERPPREPAEPVTNGDDAVDEDTRYTQAVQLAEARRRAEAARLAEEVRREEEERRAEIARREERERQTEERRRAEQARLAEEVRREEEARRAELERRAEQDRRAEAARREEEERQAGARLAEEQRQAEQRRRTEAERRVSEERQAEEERRAEQARREVDERRAADAAAREHDERRRNEEQRRSDETRAENARRDAEQRRDEDERRAAQVAAEAATAASRARREEQDRRESAAVEQEERGRAAAARQLEEQRRLAEERARADEEDRRASEAEHLSRRERRKLRHTPAELEPEPEPAGTIEAPAAMATPAAEPLNVGVVLDEVAAYRAELDRLREQIAALSGEFSSVDAGTPAAAEDAAGAETRAEQTADEEPADDVADDAADDGAGQRDAMPEAPVDSVAEPIAEPIVEPIAEPIAERPAEPAVEYRPRTPGERPGAERHDTDSDDESHPGVAPAVEDRPAERRPDPWAAPRATEQRGSDDFEAPRIWRAGSTGFESPDAAGREPESRATPEPSDLEPSEAVERDRDAVITGAVEDAAVAEATAAPVAEEPPAPTEPESEAAPPPGTDLARRLAEANVRPPSEDFDRARGGAHDSENYDEPPPPRPSFRRAFRRFFDPSSASGSDSGTEEGDQGGLPETPAPAASDESGESFKAWLDRTAPVGTPDEPPAELAHAAGIPQSDSSPEHVSPDEPDAEAVAPEAYAAEPPSEPTDVAERVDEAAEEPAADGSHLRRNPLRRAAGWLFQPAPHPDGDEAQIDPAHGGAEANGLAADPDDAVPIEPLPFVEVPPRPLFFRPHTEAPAVPDQPAESPAASESADEPEFPPQPEPAEEPEPPPESEPADELEQREHVEHLAQREEPGPPEVAAATILATPEPAPTPSPSPSPSEAELTAASSAPAAPESDDSDVAAPPPEPVLDPGTLRPGSDLPRRLAQANAEALARAEVRAPLVDAPVEARTEEREQSRRGAIALQERPGRTTEEAPSGGGTTGVLRTLGKNSLLRFLLTLALIVVLALLLRTYVISPYYIPSASMEQTLHGCTGCNNDHVLVNKLSYHLHPIHRGDVVVFHRPASWDVSDKVLIKRVIGLPGDVLTDRNGVVYINGDQLAEPYIDPQCTGGTLDLPRTVVPAGDLFVMGDDRCQSADSRSFGPIPKSTVIGRAFLIIWPLGRIHWL